MSDDLLGRLRRKGRWVTIKRVPLFPQENEEEWRPDADSAEAADEIERLEAENELLSDMTEIADMLPQINEQADEIERLRAEIRRLRVPPAVRMAARVVANRIKHEEGTHDIPNTVLTVALWCLGELDLTEVKTNE